MSSQGGERGDHKTDITCLVQPMEIRPLKVRHFRPDSLGRWLISADLSDGIRLVQSSILYRV